VQRGFAVPDRDDEAVADEEQDLAELEGVVGGEPCGLEDEEQRVAVELQLRALMGLDRVLDGEPCRSNSRRTASNSSSLGW
jgi:hypothetical protein